MRRIGVYFLVCSFALLLPAAARDSRGQQLEFAPSPPSPTTPAQQEDVGPRYQVALMVEAGTLVYGDDLWDDYYGADIYFLLGARLAVAGVRRIGGEIAVHLISGIIVTAGPLFEANANFGVPLGRKYLFLPHAGIGVTSWGDVTFDPGLAVQTTGRTVLRLDATPRLVVIGDIDFTWSVTFGVGFRP